MNNVKVSIIIPVYNPGELLNNCLDSASNQTLNDIEIICIDDESTDGSMDILNQYAKIDSRFKVFSQSNSGAGMARNKGLEYANGEYIVFLDSDDYIEFDMCECLYNHAKALIQMWFYLITGGIWKTTPLGISSILIHLRKTIKNLFLIIILYIIRS